MFQKILQFFKPQKADSNYAQPEAQPVDTELPIENIVSTAELKVQMQELMSSTFDKWFGSLPVAERLDYLSGILEETQDSDVNWDRINELLQMNIKPFDYNAFRSVRSYQDIMREIYKQIDSRFNIKPWRRVLCRDCGTVFEMLRSEVEFYEGKGLSLPTHCRGCRNQRKQAKVVPPKTAMQLAFKKAGL